MYLIKESYNIIARRDPLINYTNNSVRSKYLRLRLNLVELLLLFILCNLYVYIVPSGMIKRLGALFVWTEWHPTIPNPMLKISYRTTALHYERDPYYSLCVASIGKEFWISQLFITRFSAARTTSRHENISTCFPTLFLPPSSAISLIVRTSWCQLQ